MITPLQEVADTEFKTRQETMRAEDEERMAKNRAKRLKKKAKRDKKGKPKAAGANGTTGSTRTARDVSDPSDSSDDSDGGKGQKKRRLGQGAPGSVVFRGADDRAKDDDQPREEDVVARRIERAVYNPDSAAPVATSAGINIVDDD